mmetsp:Transcript_42435/g.137021  ORF Transcript_42435/g.137021 Transcript_42435/m.137021 type:complete len:357 (+) Transcript_42435:70-1140(+)
MALDERRKSSEEIRLVEETGDSLAAAKDLDSECSPGDGEDDRERFVERDGLSWLGVARVVVSVAVYLSVGPALILVNRHLLKVVGFDFPMMLSGLGLVGASLTAVILVNVLRVVEPSHRSMLTPRFVATNLLPIGAAMAATLAAGNAVYLYLPVGFIQMLKSFTPTVTLAMLCLLRIEFPSPLVSMTVLGMCGGTAAASYGAPAFDLTGLCIMLSAEASEALRLVLTQKLLQNHSFGVVEGQYYMAPISGVWLFASAAVFELPRALSTNALAMPLANPWPFLLSMALGAGVNYCAAAVIKLTNSVTLKVLSTARNASLVLVSAAALNEEVSRIELVGYSITLISFGMYQYFRARGA